MIRCQIGTVLRITDHFDVLTNDMTYTCCNDKSWSYATCWIVYFIEDKQLVVYILEWSVRRFSAGTVAMPIITKKKGNIRFDVYLAWKIFLEDPHSQLFLTSGLIRIYGGFTNRVDGFLCTMIMFGDNFLAPINKEQLPSCTTLFYKEM